MLRPFHANLFAVPSAVASGPTVELDGELMPTLRAATWDAYFPVTFEQAIDALSRLPRVDAEPDGFFVISGEIEGNRWQVSGHLFDFNDRLHRVELHGHCPESTLDSLLACFGERETAVAFELVAEGVALDEPTFRHWSQSDGERGA